MASTDWTIGPWISMRMGLCDTSDTDIFVVAFKVNLFNIVNCTTFHFLTNRVISINYELCSQSSGILVSKPCIFCFSALICHAGMPRVTEQIVLVV